MPEESPRIPSREPPGCWRTLWLLALACLLAMGLWFSATAVVPELAARYELSAGAQAWLTMTVQLGFVAGALLSAVLNLADRYPAQFLIALCASAGGMVNLAITALDPASVTGLWLLMALRFLTGMLLAGVYPPGMKLLATWFRVRRGLALGVLIGALTVGSAGPHLLAAFLPVPDPASGIETWRPVLAVASIGAFVAAAIAGTLVKSGPLLARATRFHWRHAGIIFGDPAVRKANFGYLGHMWELYAMWTWVPLCLLESFRDAGIGRAPGRVAAFTVIAIGALGCVVAGQLADRWGRTLIASAALVISGTCALSAGFAFGAPVLLTVICLVWGLAVVADSAQFSSAVSELCDPRYVGTALTMQTCSGFLLTVVTIRLLTPLREAAGWGPAFAILALGPVFGIVSMLRLRRMPEARRMASGRR